jgi:hypothetical protein
MTQPYSPVPPPMPAQAQTLSYASPIRGYVGAWRRGNQLITTREADLGDACVKCGASADGWRWHKTLYWISPLWILLIFLPFGLIILLIIYLIVRKTARISAGLCPVHRKRRNIGLAITATLATLGFVAIIGGFVYAANARSSDPPVGIVLILAALAMFIAAAVTGVTMARVLSPRKIDDQYAYLNGAGPGFLATVDVAP